MAVSTESSPVKVICDPQGETAQLVFPASFRQTSMARQICHAALTEHHVELTDAVLQAVDQLLQGPSDQAELCKAIVARAQPPRDGVDGTIQWMDTDNPRKTPAKPLPETSGASETHPASENAAETETDSDSNAHNFYEDSAFRMVTTGQIVARIIPPVPGEDGRDITGKTLPAKPAKPCDITFDESLIQDAKGNLIAQEDGVLIRSENSACIRQTIEIQDYVDFSTGNIDFTGNVVVHKGVRDCFQIRVGGNVEVHGLIEAATIECDGDLLAKGGMAGREQGTAKVGRNLNAKYLDNVRAEVQGDMTLQREAINCDLLVHGHVHSPSGSIIGGTLTVRGKVHVHTLGSPGNVKTRLVLGSVPKLDPLLQQLDPFIKELEDKRKKIDDEQQMITQNTKTLTAQLKERQTELTFELMMIDTPLKKALDARSRVEARADQLRCIDLTVEHMLHANTLLIIQNVGYKVRNDLPGPLHIQKKEGQLICRQHDKDRVLATLCDSVA